MAQNTYLSTTEVENILMLLSTYKTSKVAEIFSRSPATICRVKKMAALIDSDIDTARRAANDPSSSSARIAWMVFAAKGIPYDEQPCEAVPEKSVEEEAPKEAEATAVSDDLLAVAKEICMILKATYSQQEYSRRLLLSIMQSITNLAEAWQ